MVVKEEDELAERRELVRERLRKLREATFEAAAAMVEHGLPAVAVSNQSNRLLGLITEDDLLRVLYDAQA